MSDGIDVGGWTDEDYDQLAVRIWPELFEDGRPVWIDLQPGNGTRYCVMLTPLGSPTAFGQIDLGMEDNRSAVIMSLPLMRSSYMFECRQRCTVHWSYLGAKMRVGESDAQVLASLLRAIGRVGDAR